MNKAVEKFMENEKYTIEDLLNEYETSGEVSTKTDNARIFKKDGTGPHGQGMGPGKGKADGSGMEEEDEDELLQPGGLVGLGEEEDEEEVESKDDEDQDNNEDDEEMDEKSCKKKR